MLQKSSKAFQQREPERPPPYQVPVPSNANDTKGGRSELQKQSWRHRCRDWLTNLFQEEKTVAPPDYRNYPLPHVRPHIIKFINDQGVALDAPQWLWGARRSREWLTSVYENLFNMPPKAAARKASKFYGFGGTLFTRRRQTWEEELGRAEGEAIYMLIISLQHAPGAVVKTLSRRLAA
jgi:hypothetical protein